MELTGGTRVSAKEREEAADGGGRGLAQQSQLLLGRAEADRGWAELRAR